MKNIVAEDLFMILYLLHISIKYLKVPMHKLGSKHMCYFNNYNLK